MPVEYREEPCRSALNRVQGMMFKWSLNPYMGCVHRCTFCYVRAFERRADRPSGERYRQSIRVKVNVGEGLARELGPPRQRLRALRVLVDAGIDVGVGMAPILPGLSDDPARLADVVRAARDAGATGVWCNILHLNPGTREHFLEHLARDWPALLPRYDAIYRRGAYPDREESEPPRARVAALRRELDVADRRLRPLGPPPAPEQLALAITD